MDDVTLAGSEELRWLDANMVWSATYPDEAFDCVFMLEPHDWLILDEMWVDRSPEWREALAYLSINGPPLEARGILRRALADPSDDVAEAAAESLCAHVLHHLEKAPFDLLLLPRLRELKRRDTLGSMTKVDAVLRLHGGAE